MKTPLLFLFLTAAECSTTTPDYYPFFISLCTTNYQLKGHRTEKVCTFFKCMNRIINEYTFGDIICQYISPENPLVLDQHAQNSTTDTVKFLNSTIMTIPLGWMEELTGIKTIYLNNSQVVIIEPGALNALIKLQKLYLQDNFITQIHRGTFNALIPLQELNLANNKITSIEESTFIGLFKLRKLNLSQNNIKTIDPEAFITCKNLAELNLSHNNIKFLSESIFCQQQALTKLNLAHNSLEVISDVLQNLTMLNSLILRNNSIKFINFEELSGDVIVGRNHISNLTKIGPKVKNLKLNFNTIRYIPPKALEDCTILQTLELKYNEINDIHVDTFENLKFLKVLDLAGNNISQIQIGTFRNLANLIILNISLNRIAEFEYGSFTGLYALQTLDISNNNITDLEITTFSPLQNLIYLNISNNFITKLNANRMVVYLGNLLEITLHGNKWRCEWLANVIQLLQKHGVVVKPFNSHQDTNVCGIACTKEPKQVTNKFRSPIFYLQNRTTSSVLINQYSQTQTDLPSTRTTQKTTLSTSTSQTFVEEQSPLVLAPEYDQTEVKSCEQKDVNKNILTVIAIVVSLLVIIQAVKFVYDCKFRKRYKWITKFVSKKQRREVTL